MNPLDYKIQDPDAMRYALMQDAGYKKGGIVKERLFDEQDKGDWFNKKGERKLPQGDKKIRSPMLRPPKGMRFPVDDPKMEKDVDFSHFPLKNVNVDELYSIQNNVREDNLKPTHKDVKPIHVVVWKGKQWVVDGNHRASAAWSDNKKIIPAHVLDLDKNPAMGRVIFGGEKLKMAGGGQVIAEPTTSDMIRALDTAPEYAPAVPDVNNLNQPARGQLQNQIAERGGMLPGQSLADFVQADTARRMQNTMELPEKAMQYATGSSMGLDPMMGSSGVHITPGAMRFAGEQAIELASPLHEAYMRGELPMVKPASEVVKRGVEPVAPKLTEYEIAHQVAQRNAALPIEQGGLGLHPNNTSEERLLAQNYYDYLHGTQRLDRLLEGKGIDPKRATSGPMPYGTDAPELASKYSTSKSDTSRYDEGNMSDYFQVNPKDLGIRGKNLVNVENTWNYLSPEQKKEILSGYYRTGYANPEEATGAFTLHPEGSNASIASKQHLDAVLKEERGNPLAALRNLWGESGELYNNPEDLSKIYKVAGYPYDISQTNAPWTTAQGVFTGKARIDQPLITSDTNHLSNNVIPYLKEQFKNDKTRLKPGADMWAKESRYTPKQWVNELEKDISENKNSFVWTSIPDKVTEALKKLGHDGIIDVGGKLGGEGHQVVIPFNPNQIRSKFAAFDPLEKESTLLHKAEGGSVSIDEMRHELTRNK